MVHTIGSHLKAWRESLSLKQADAASVLGLSPSTYQNYERDVRAPNTEGWKAFAKNRINTNWLLTGEGPMLLPGSVSDGALQKAAALVGLAAPKGSAKWMTTDDSAQVSHAVQELAAPGYIALPLYDSVRAAAGHGAVNTEEQAEDALIFKEDWIRHELGANPQNLFLIRVSGDSMEPTLRAGDVVLVDKSASQPDREGIYIMRMGEMLLVKRLQALPGGRIRVTSVKSAFEPWTIGGDNPADDVQIYGRVIWSGRRW